MKIVLEKDNNLTVSISEELQGVEIAYALNTLIYQLLQRFPDSNMEFAGAILTAFADRGQNNVLYLDKIDNDEVFSCFANGNKVSLPIATLETLPYLNLKLLEDIMTFVEQEKGKKGKQPHEETHNH